MQRLMPNDQEAERIILGCILIENKEYFLVQAIITAEDFYLESHRHIYRAMSRLQMASKPIDYLTVRNELQKSGHLETCGGVSYITSLTEGVFRAINIGHYSQIIREKSRLRQMIQECESVVEQCFADENTPEEIIEAHESNVRKIGTGSATGPSLCSDAIDATYAEIVRRYDDKRKVTGIASGIEALDFLTTGLQPGDLNILAGKTGMGKTALALNLTMHSMLYDRRKVLIISLEMTREQIGMRMISSLSEVPAYHIRTGYIAASDWPKIGKAAGAISDCRMWIYDKSLTLAELDAMARRLSDAHGLDLIMVDYLQLVKIGSRKVENRTQEVTEISRALKAIATDLKVPVLALSQLNQDGEVRESRAIEQDASVVMVIEMDKNDLKSLPRVPCSININKNRNGSLGKVDAFFEKEIVKFVQAKEAKCQ